MGLLSCFCRFQGYQIVSKGRPDHTGYIYMYKFFIYKSQCTKCTFLALCEPWVTFNGQILFFIFWGTKISGRYALTHINIHVKYGSNSIRTFLVEIPSMKQITSYSSSYLHQFHKHQSVSNIRHDHDETDIQ